MLNFIVSIGLSFFKSSSLEKGLANRLSLAEGLAFFRNLNAAPPAFK
jgi:hypothetical protein